MRKLLIALTIPPLALVQDIELVDVRSLRCSYSQFTLTFWQEDQPVVEVDEGDDEDVFHIDNIDYDAGSARLIGNLAAQDLSVVLGSTSASFIEVTPMGNVNVTTVYHDREEATGRFKMVASNNRTFIGQPAPSQYFGYCEAFD